MMAEKTHKADLLTRIQAFDLKGELNPPSPSEVKGRLACKRDPFQIYKDEDVYQKQLSKVRWLKEGDNNTFSFHKITSFHKKFNLATKIS